MSSPLLGQQDGGAVPRCFFSLSHGYGPSSVGASFAPSQQMLVNWKSMPPEQRGFEGMLTIVSSLGWGKGVGFY